MNKVLLQRIFLALLAAAATILMIHIALEALIQGSVSAPAIAPVEQPVEHMEPAAPKLLFQYIEIIDSCGPYFEGTCVNVRSGPGEEYRAVTRLRTGVVLKVGETQERNERTWYKIAFDEPIRYPERVNKQWYVAGEFAHPFMDEGIVDLSEGTRASTDSTPPTDSRSSPSDIRPSESRTGQASSPQAMKRIFVDRSSQILYAYEGGTLFMQVHISSGLEFTPTPRGTFTVYKKTPTRYMQGPLPGISAQYYDLPGVPWNLYFTHQGGVIHGAYWHDRFGKRWSHGCVNLPLEQARTLYLWADVGTPVIVRD